MAETGNSKKRNLGAVLDKDADTENDVSSKRQLTRKQTSSLFGSNSDISPQEFALSIDHVLESILSSLDQNSLLQCRLVSLRWKQTSKSVMKKKHIRISFTYNWHYKAHVISSADARSREFPEAVRKSKLQDLTLFLKNSYTGIAGPFNMDSFPCNTIEIRHGSVFNQQVRAFLDTFGNHIRNLYLAYTKNDTNPRVSCSDLLNKLEHILCSQVPNVEVFSFFMDYNGVRHRHHLTSKCTTGNKKVSQSSRPNTSLRILTTGGDILKRILENIKSNFPNLNEISVA